MYKEFLRTISADKEALRDVLRLTMGLYQPKYNVNFDIQFAQSLIKQSLAQAFNVTEVQIKQLF